MLTYRNEAAFSKALVTAMRSKGMFVQRIESGATGKGIPDLFVITKGTPMWIELKRVHSVCRRPCVEIPWRPGQQAWLHDVSRRGVMCCTLACFDDGIVMIHHNIIFQNNIVCQQELQYFPDIRSLLA